jgi:predicted HD superfamily hydrolase involved in NAD metabolism
VTGAGFIDLCKRVRASIGQRHRYAHTLRVTRMAVRLARRHGEAPDRARLAGMLHDLARLYSPERLLGECEARGLPIDSFERANPKVLHARLGAELAREQFGVRDEGVLSAIRAHTLATPDPSRLDEIVYLADSLEPGRDFEERADLEKLAFLDLDAAMNATLQSSLSYLTSTGHTLAPITAAAIKHFSTKEKSTATSA